MNPLNHVAIIMDGNGRWGLKHKNSRNAGHKAGLNTVEKIIKGSIKNKISFLTLFAFSTENWKRPKKEINFLFNLIINYFKKELNNETLRVDTGCLVAFSPGIHYDIQRSGNLKSMFFSGEGLFLTTLKGTGTVYLQSLPFSRLADRIIESAPKGGDNRKGEGSVLGIVGDMVGGD